MDVDSRGVRRGRCQVDGCDCNQFERQESSNTCAYCGDYPAKHEKVPPSRQDELDEYTETNTAAISQRETTCVLSTHTEQNMAFIHESQQVVTSQGSLEHTTELIQSASAGRSSTDHEDTTYTTVESVSSTTTQDLNRTQEEIGQTTISNTIDVPRANDIQPIPETSEQGHMIADSPPSSSSGSDNSDNESSTEMTQVVPYGGELVPMGNQLNLRNLQLTNVGQFNYETGNIHIHNTETVTEESSLENLRSQSLLSMEIGKWEDSFYIETRAYNEAKTILSEYGHVTVFGNAGDGKTAMAKHLMHQYAAKRYEPIIVHSPEDFKDLINTKKKQIALIDDVFGTSGLDKDKVNKWMSLFEQWDKNHNLHGEMPKEKEIIETLLIFTSRNHIAKQAENEIQDIRYFKRLYIVSLSDTEFALNIKEKKQILETFAKRRKREIDIHTANGIANLHPSTHGFPHCIDLFTNHQNVFSLGLKFFYCPLQFLRKEIKHISQNNQKKFCALVIAIMQNGQVDESCIEKNLEAVSKVLNPHGMFSKSEIMIAVEQLVGSFFKKEDDNFIFCHPSLIDAVTYVLLEEIRDVQLIIQKSKFEFICERMKPKCVNKKSSDEFISIPESQYVHIAERFLQEIQCGNKSGVAISEFLDDIKFIDQLFCIVPDNDFHLFFDESEHDLSFIIYAAHYRKVEFCTKLLTKTLHQNKNINEFDRVLSDAFIVACRHGNRKLVELLFTRERFLRNAFSNRSSLGKWHIFAHPMYSVPIKEAIVGSDFDVFTFLVDLGADINYKDSDFNSLLHHCADFGECQILEYLLNKYDLDPNVINCDYYTPLFYAKSCDVIRVLIKYGGDVNHSNIYGKTPLFYSRNTEIANELVRQGCCISHVDNERKLPIFDLVRFEDVICVDLLKGMTQKGLDLSHVDTHGRSLLHHVAASVVENQTVLSCLDYLIPLTDPNITDKLGCTALHYAVGCSGLGLGCVWYEDVAVARTKVFLEYSHVNKHITNNNQRTALLETKFAKVAEEWIKSEGTKDLYIKSNEDPIEILESNIVPSKTLLELLYKLEENVKDLWPLMKKHLLNILRQSEERDTKSDISDALSLVHYEIPAEDLQILVVEAIKSNSLHFVNLIAEKLSCLQWDSGKFLSLIMISRSSQIIEKLISLGTKAHSNFIGDIAKINPDLLFDLVEKDLLTTDILKCLKYRDTLPFTLKRYDETILFHLLHKSFQRGIYSPRKGENIQEINEELFCTLIKNGVNLNVQNKNGHTVLHLLACGTSSPVQEFMNDDTFSNTYSNRAYCLHRAREDVHETVNCCINFLLDNGANLDVCDNNGRLPIHLVNNPTLALLLLKKSSYKHLRKRDNNGNTPLIAITKNGAMSFGVYLQLKEMNADFRVKDKSGATCLHYFIRYPEDELSVMKTLQHILETISVNAITHAGKTVLHYLITSHLDESIIESRMEYLFNNRFNICIEDSLFRNIRHSNIAIKLLSVYKALKIKNTDHLRTSVIVHMAENSILNCEILDFMLMSGLQIGRVGSDHDSLFFYILISAQSDDETFQLCRKLMKHGLKIRMSEHMLKNLIICSRAVRRLAYIETIAVDLGQTDQITELKSINQKINAYTKEPKGSVPYKCGTFKNGDDLHVSSNKHSDMSNDLVSLFLKCLDKLIENDHTFITQFDDFWSKVHVDIRLSLMNKTALKLANSEGAVGIKKFMHLLVSKGVDINIRTDDGKTLLHVASSSHILQYLIKCGADVNAEDNNRQTPLFCVQLKENVHVLVNAGADINHRNKAGQTPLHCVDKLDVAKSLVYLGADKYAKDKFGKTPIECNNNIEIRQHLIQSGCDMDIQLLASIILGLNSSNLNKAFISYWFSDHTIYSMIQQSPNFCSTLVRVLTPSCLNTTFVISILDKLFECTNTDPNCKDDKGNTAIHLLLDLLNTNCIWIGRPSHGDIYTRLSYILKKGGNLLVTDSKGIPALGKVGTSALAQLCFEHMKERSSDPRIFEAMLLFCVFQGICLPEMIQHIKVLNGNVNVLDEKNMSVLHHLTLRYPYIIHRRMYIYKLDEDIYSIFLANISDCVSTLRHCGFNFNTVDLNGNTALSIACKRGDKDLIEILLSNGSNPSQLTHNGIPLFCSIHDNAIIHCFIQHGVDLKIMKENIKFYLAKWGLMTIEILQALGERNVKLDSCDSNGDTLLHHDLAVEVFHYLTKCFKNVNIRNTEGQTPLFKTCLMSKQRIMSKSKKVEILFEAGADPNIPDNNNKLPLEIVDEPYLAEMIVINGGVAKYSFKNHTSAFGFFPKPFFPEYSVGNQSSRFLEKALESENSMTKTMLYLIEKNILTLQSLEYVYKKGANLGIRDRNNATLIHACCMHLPQNHNFGLSSYLSNNFSEISNLVHFLTKHGLSINTPNNQGNTPLHTLLQHSVVNKSILQCLLENQADWSLINRNGKLPVPGYLTSETNYTTRMFAAYFKNAKQQYINKKPLIWYVAEQTRCFSLDLLRESIAHDIDLSYIDVDGTSILDCVFNTSLIDQWEALHLLRGKVDIGIQNRKSGETCLHRFIRCCKRVVSNAEQFKEFVCFLIENGVDINAVESNKMTAFDSFILFRLYNHFPGLIPFFISQGASIHNWIVKDDLSS